MTPNQNSVSKPPDPIRDPARLQALEATQLLDSPPEPVFDQLTRLAAKVLEVPAALITLIDDDRQFFKSQCGLTGELAADRQGPLSHSVCRYVVEGGQPLLVEDAREHPLLRHSPGVRASGVVAYAGIPLVNTQGYRLGTFCVFDSRRRGWKPAEIDLLRAFAAQAMSEIELRSKAAQLGESLFSAREREKSRRVLTRLSLHDLRAPLNSLMLSLDMMPELGALNESQAEYLQLCIRAGDTLRGAVDRLLDVEVLAERGVAGLQCDMCDPTGLAERACEEAETLARDKMIEVRRDFPPLPPPIHVDADKWVRVLVNLLTHAVKLAPESGQIGLTVSAVMAEEVDLVFTVWCAGGTVAPIDWDRAIESENCLRESMPGGEAAALGLLYSKRVVAAHQGKIWATAEPGRAAVLHVSVPARARAADC